LFLADEPSLLTPHKQAKEMLGGISPKDSRQMVKDCELALKEGYCQKRVAKRSGIACEEKLSGRAKHNCEVDADCNSGDTANYECVDSVCVIPRDGKRR